MKTQLIDINKLLTLHNFAISHQRVYLLLQQGRFDSVEIDGVRFIYLGEKTEQYKKTKSKY